MAFAKAFAGVLVAFLVIDIFWIVRVAQPMYEQHVSRLLRADPLFGAAAYWGVAGDFLDFWDAALWLFAFIFIELNVFEWQYETSHELAVAT